MKLAVKRIYEEREESDGFRVLVDRLWPRGVSKERAGLDLWFKMIAPSPELLKWFGHEPAKWEEFSRRYSDELEQNRQAFAELVDAIKDKPRVTLLFAARDQQHNNAVLLENALRKRGIAE